MMTTMVYVYCPLSVVTLHHFLPSCTQNGVTLNDVMSIPAKKAYKAISLVQSVGTRFLIALYAFLAGNDI